METVTVDTVRPDPSAAHSTLAIGEGVNEAGERVTFAGEVRHMGAIAKALADGSGEDVQVELESYQILTRETA